MSKATDAAERPATTMELDTVETQLNELRDRINNMPAPSGAVDPAKIREIIQEALRDEAFAAALRGLPGAPGDTVVLGDLRPRESLTVFGDWAANAHAAAAAWVNEGTGRVTKITLTALAGFVLWELGARAVGAPQWGVVGLGRRVLTRGPTPAALLAP